MNILLTAAGIIGRDEFVTTAEPNVYVTVLRITPEQAALFGGNERIGIRTVIEEDNAYVTQVFGVGEDNRHNGYCATEELGADDWSEAQKEVLFSLEDREGSAINAFVEAVGQDELEEMYSELEQRSALKNLMEILGAGPQA